MNREHYVGSVRAYYSNVTRTQSDTTEIYFDKRFLPSYLWVFPLPGDRANVGFGMLSSEIARRKINLKNTFYDFIERNSALRTKLANAVQNGPLQGFGLPLGSGIGCISGERFMLAGDAASLIDPASGDGIGNAMLSGLLAAQQAVKCFVANNFTGSFISGYDAALKTAISGELKTHYRAQRVLSKAPFLLDVAFRACSYPALKKIIQKGL
jgi:flavin-dependent dehydrogenase